MSRREKRGDTASRVLTVLIRAESPPRPRAAALARALAGSGAQVELAAGPGGAAADVIIWTDPAARKSPLPLEAVNVMDLHGAARPEALEFCRGAALLLVGSEAAAGAWAEALGRAGSDVPLAVVPVSASVRRRKRAEFNELRVIAGRDPTPASLALIGRAAEWAGARGMPCGVEDSEGAAGLLALERGGPALVGDGAGAAVLDVRLGPAAAQELVPDSLIELLAGGAPVLCCGETPLLQQLEAFGAGLAVTDLSAGLDALAGLPQAGLQALSDGAAAFAADAFDPERAAAALLAALRRAVERQRRLHAAWMTPRPGVGPGGHVLAISDEALNLVDIRLHLPLAALHRRGLIDGYSVLRHGEIAFSTAPAQQFDAVWVHRSVSPGVQLLLRALGRPFVYDLDDNLLVSPSYRTAFPPETIEAAHAMLAECAVLSCATARLFELVQHQCGTRLAAKAAVMPNLALDAPAEIEAGRPRAVVWASSDSPALTESRPEVERAVRDFCLAHRLRLVCIGSKPPSLLAQSAIELDHVALQSYPAYLARLRAEAPGILVCPLETAADGQTQAFVDGKSDIKAIEARQSGLVGVFSRARPYTDSDLGPEIVCENTYAGWLAGLERAAAGCARAAPAAPWPPHRDANALGLLPWTEALARTRTERPLTLDAVLQAVRYVQEQEQTLLGSRESFDEAFYLGRHEDVRQAVEQGVVSSGYDHYVTSGIRESRAARRLPTAAAASDVWWSGLLGTVSRLETETAARARALEELRARVRLRRRPAPAAAKEEVAPARDDQPHFDVQWHPGGEVDQACPVCDAPGPQPILLRASGHTLAQCRACQSCFYEERVVYDYAGDDASGTKLQVYLEQNASIYHQSRLLFAVEGVTSVLDVGCGFGFPVDVATTVLGWRATGIDPARAAGAGSRLLGADIRQAYLTDDTDVGEPFDLVVASEVIEHMPDPYAFLALLRRWMGRDGTLALTTPDAAALAPGLGVGSLIGILAVDAHLILFNRESLGAALRRAGFRHVQVTVEGDGLTAFASDRPVRLRSDAAERHVQAYKRYLEHLLETAETGGPLWSGAAGRLLSLQQDGGALPELQALYARIAAAWRARFGIDLLRLRLPALLPEGAFAGPERVRSDALAAGQPINLATALFARARMEWRTPGRTPEAVLAYARAAYLHAVQTRRVLQGDELIDLDLKRTAWRARVLIVDCLAELAPEVEPELLFALATRSPGALHDRIDPPAEAVVERIVPAFITLVQADRFDAAEMLAPWIEDLDAVCATCAEDLDRRFHALFTIGVLRLVHRKDAMAALAAFERMEMEARLLVNDRAHGEAARHFLGVATEHVRLAAERLAA